MFLGLGVAGDDREPQRAFPAVIILAFVSHPHVATAHHPPELSPRLRIPFTYISKLDHVSMSTPETYCTVRENSKSGLTPTGDDVWNLTHEDIFYDLTPGIDRYFVWSQSTTNRAGLTYWQ